MLKAETFQQLDTVQTGRGFSVINRNRKKRFSLNKPWQISHFATSILDFVAKFPEIIKFCVHVTVKVRNMDIVGFVLCSGN